MYAIGDAHGRLDLLERLLDLMQADAEHRGPAQTEVVVLGDFIDRGPGSAEITRRLKRYSAATQHLVVLKGNHEEMMVEALRGDVEVLRAWLTFGGGATLLSWGVPEKLIDGCSPGRLLGAAREQVGDDVLAWLSALPLTHTADDFLFVHAGLRPGVAVHRQEPDDLLWISEEFLAHEGPHPAFVVHGHNVSEAGPDIRHNRIGLDTGAYRTGRLTALGLEGGSGWVLST